MALSVVRRLKSSLFTFIDNLPDDVKQKIYYDYFDIAFKYERVIKIFKRTSELTSKSSEILSRYVKKILNDEDLKKYMLCHCVSFNNVYQYNDYGFKFFENENERFALAWMWNEYH